MTRTVEAELDRYNMINFEETELRLGLPGGTIGKDNGDELVKVETLSAAATRASTTMAANGKRGFSETVDLKLNLSSSKDLVSRDVVADKTKEKTSAVAMPPFSNDHAKPPAKAQVVGWPPVRSCRKNLVAVQKPAADNEAEKGSSSAAFVKVSMDGAPYLRKVDLKMYKSYQELSNALSKMFSSFTIGNCGSHGMKDFMNESKLIDLLNGSDYVPTYEDKDGDWMLVGDVPWEMFVNSCKRLRIMKGSEAIGLAPKAVERCKNRS